MSERKTHDEKCEATGSNYIVYCRCPERRLERQRDAAVEALKRASEAIGYASHEDSVGYRICCQVQSYNPHEKDCYIIATLRAIEEGRK